ncbi:molybdopterin-guanine dinucleotide biosynthesis protein A [Virgibacillus halotolerans]|uniref:molybdenum cofactor guanylyltransferase n=1 Tax=Virgibacillus halotolerans TaxID=1071053 RepID=UPI00195F7132|nr:molybdenum cofactor guanylyltransferase [Virgibacillus halotolerans]MBM7598404.1 molybdopterin-guanine dinucleotide biosynthesis protein A [Virgibacillus halotolerans]
METCGIILSGGNSTRMGTNKSLLTIRDKTVIEWISAELNACTDKVALIANEQEQYEFLHLETYADRYINKGPLAGLEAALYHIDADLFVIAACDMPFVNGQVYNYLLEQIEDFDAVVPVYNNRIHPLAGIYRKSVLPKIQQQIEKNNLKVRGFFEHIKVNYIREFIPIPTTILEKHFFNMNNPAQYEEAKRF